MLELTPDTAHLWYVFPDEVRAPELLAAYHALMAPEEAVKQARFHFPEGRHEYLLTRALVRTVLSRYAPVAPAAWTFVLGSHGRPEIAGPRGGPPLRFNLSNTRGLIVCLVALERDVGVDVEDTARQTETVEIADRFFSPAEVRALRAHPTAQQRDRFYDYWTLKEAYIKARGMGLALPLDQFSFHLDERSSMERPKIQISFDRAIPDDPSDWQFSLFRPTARHRMAAAIRRGAGGPVAIQLHATVPLLDPPQVSVPRSPH